MIQKEKGSDYEYTLPLEHGLVAGSVYKETLVYLEEAMAQMKPMATILRLLCLLSLFNNGISSGDFERVKHQFLQTYGFDKICLLQKLKNMGILTSREALVALKASMQGSKDRTSAPSFFQVAKKLGLNSGANNPGNVVASSQMQEDVSYVFNGAFTPLTCKLVKDTLASKATLEESLREMKVKHKIEMPETGTSTLGKVVVVYFVGGYTFSEVAAFRHLQTILGYQFIVAGTSRISGQDLMNCDVAMK